MSFDPNHMIFDSTDSQYVWWLCQISCLCHYLSPCQSFQNVQTLGQFFEPLYANSINKLHHAFENSALDTKEEQKIICLAWGFTQILMNILCLSSFKHHMRVITMDGKFLDSLTANLRNKDVYWKFGQQYGIISAEPGNVTAPSAYDSGFDIDPVMPRTLQVWKFIFAWILSGMLRQLPLSSMVTFLNSIHS